MRAASADFKIQLGVVILGAGKSTRMGQPKLLMPWGGTTVIGRLVEQWNPLARQVAVVCAPHDCALNDELERLGMKRRVMNATPERGMFSSIQCAAQWPEWEKSLTHWAIVLGDQPHLRDDTLLRLLGFVTTQPDAICQPQFSGHLRHPVLIPKAAFDELAKSRAETLKAFLSGYRTAACEIADPGLALDIDRPEDYASALELARIAQRNR
jgi:molybdenum cofactor cytidylyltransferase